MSVTVRITQQIVVNDVALFNNVTTLAAEGSDRISVVVPAGESDMEVSLVTGAIEDIQLFSIEADEYQESSVDVLSYKIHDAGNPSIVLDKPVLINGVGAVALLGDPLDKIFLSNSGAADKTVSIIVGRDVTP